MWITLTPRETTVIAGTKSMADLPSRDPQEFWFIWQGDNPIVSTDKGTTRRLDFVLVGSFDAEVAVGDHWETAGQKFEITYLAPYNGYEVKCGGVSIGANP